MASEFSTEFFSANRIVKADLRAARTADEDFALVLRIEVDEVFAREHPLAQLERTREARLLVDGEQRLDGTVLHRLVEHHGQRGGHADTAVGAQRRTFGPDPLAVDTRADGIVVEVELHIGVLFADHVHVRLEDHGCALLHARRGGLAHHDVADGVLFIFDMVLFGEIDQKINDFALLLRRTRHTRDGVELFPDKTRFQRGYFRHRFLHFCKVRKKSVTLTI